VKIRLLLIAQILSEFRKKICAIIFSPHKKRNNRITKSSANISKSAGKNIPPLFNQDHHKRQKNKDGKNSTLILKDTKVSSCLGEQNTTQHRRVPAPPREAKTAQKNKC
jgi:hypothetical protein